MPANVQRRVMEIWSEEKERRGDSLFNGQLFSISHSSPSRIEGCFVDYSLFLAQRRQPGLFEFLKVRPLAVTGLVRCRDGVVFGRRTTTVEMDPGSWELVPSGGIDETSADQGNVDIEAQLRLELHEEVGLRLPSGSPRPRIFTAVHDDQSHVTDIGLILRVDYSADELLSLFANVERPEHTELKIVPIARLHEFAEDPRSAVNAVSRTLLEQARALIAAP
jgi:8-oxo-dGTP pyrophosphatase MutT (NUDIX family)